MSPTLSTETARRVEQNVAKLLAGLAGDQDAPLAEEVRQAVFLARQLQTRAAALQTPAERRQQRELDRLIQSPGDKATLLQLTDQAFRSRLPHRAADQLVHLLDAQGVPRFFSTLDRTLLKGFQSFGAYLPGVAMPFVKEKMRHETANVVLPAEEELLRGHLRQRWQEGVRMNVNLLGEALLGEREAGRRLEAYLESLRRPEIEVISVKISTIYSQISALAREHTIDVLSHRLELLYRAAAQERFTRRDGTVVAKFVYLDMEEYRDKEITAEVFMRTLDRKGLEQVRAGIALQAYIPDSFATQQRITAWARQRLAAGGAPVTLRIVKGANMEMERVEASLRGWPQAPFQTKVETDANYHRMLLFGMQPENLAAVQLGIASHNLFTLAYGLVLAVGSGALDHVQFEMLEGMANHQRRALFELSQNMLLYAPACRQEDFIHAIGYLVRRLDENTGPDNFLRHAFRLQVDSEDWQRLETAFVKSFEQMPHLTATPRRRQNRAEEGRKAEGGGRKEVQTASQTFAEFSSAFRLSPSAFQNSSDTDWSLPQNDAWAEEILHRWQSRCDQNAAHVPLQIEGEEIADGRQTHHSLDPSRPDVVVARCQQATAADVARAVVCARADADGWRKLPAAQRGEILFRVADQLSVARGELMGAMLAEGGKLLTESDPEVSEAMDFCRFYALSAQYFGELPGLSAQGQGVVVVVSPWNFPLAIPCGGVAAALAAGNTVVLKPASDAVLVAYRLCQCFWQAGVPKTALQFLPCSGATVGQTLAAHDDVDAVILTGGTQTARQMLAAKPTLHLLAETGGKNATIVTAMADRDLAIKNVLHSAFSHSGQKCSATSLLILEEEVYHDSKFRETFCDAVESLHVGSAWQLHSKINPLIRPPSGPLLRALQTLEPGESWAVRPRLQVDGNPHLVSPGVKWDVQPDSFTHCTEFFGPLLAVLPARNLHEAIDLVNATGYGLTSGLESLDDREHRLWQEGLHAGNLYFNRPTTGAIVLRQPFGGMGKSAVGPGIKAGGPNYVAQLMTFHATPSPAPMGELNSQIHSMADQALFELCNALASPTGRTATLQDAPLEHLLCAIASYRYWMTEEFLPWHDHFRLVGEDNFRRYLPVRELRVRVCADDSLFELFARVAAARAAGCRTVVSTTPEGTFPWVALLEELTESWAGAIEFVEETDDALAQLVRAGQIDRIRYAHPDRVPAAVRAAAAAAGHYLADRPVSAHGRVELLWYLQEQSLAHLYHRYGNLGARADEPRAEVL